MKFRALYWWLDRWKNSTAYSDMTLEQQGAYRNLLDEAARRGGALPADERVLALACGDPLAWPRVRDVVMRRFVRQADGWHNETLDHVLSVTATRSARQQRYRETHEGFSFGGPQPPEHSRRNARRNKGRVSGSGSGSGSKDQDPDE
jgi:uncharacterized protein YdaU (DUF1376 family)